MSERDYRAEAEMHKALGHADPILTCARAHCIAAAVYERLAAFDLTKDGIEVFVALRFIIAAGEDVARGEGEPENTRLGLRLPRGRTEGCSDTEPAAAPGQPSPAQPTAIKVVASQPDAEALRLAEEGLTFLRGLFIVHGDGFRPQSMSYVSPQQYRERAERAVEAIAARLRGESK